MKKINLTLRLLIGLMLFSCSSNETLLAQNKYKGATKHQQPNIEVLPNSTEYILDQSLESDLTIKLDQKIDELFEKHNVAGITATVLIPEKGIWETNRGFISKPDNRIIDSSSVFYWASVGKLITNTLIQQLVIENKLSLTICSNVFDSIFSVIKANNRYPVFV
jgi:D-alanyl-D-alanine carboxypeptidase